MRVFGIDVEVAPGTIAAAAGERVVDLRTTGGAPFLAVDRRPDGWLIDAPGYGRHLVAPDGRRVTTGAGDVAGPRLLVAQSLPTAAALQGRDLFHASAVRTPTGVVALSGPSGSGKSTLAAGLAERGLGEPFTGDVLAVGAEGDGVVAFAGPVDGDDPASVPVADAGRLVALVLLDRVAGAEPLGRTDAPMEEVLAAAFAPHVDVPARLVTRLDVSAALVRGGWVHRLAIPPGTPVAATVDALAALLRGV